MRVREGGGGKEGKIRLVTYARFSFPVVDFVTHQCYHMTTQNRVTGYWSCDMPSTSGYIMGVILEPAARKYRDCVFDKGDSSGYC